MLANSQLKKPKLAHNFLIIVTPFLTLKTTQWGSQAVKHSGDTGTILQAKT